MKAYTLFLLVLLPLGLIASDWTLEIRTAYFQPSCKKIKDTYSKGWIDFQVEAAKRVHDYVDLWAGVSWMSKKGHEEHDDDFDFKEHTKAYILPLSVGFKFIYPLTCAMNVYLGAGVCYSFLKIKDECEPVYDSSLASSSPFKKQIHKNGLGGIAKLGVHCVIGKCTFLDFFVDYCVQRFQVSRKDLNENDTFKGHHFNADGFKIGVGFGVYF